MPLRPLLDECRPTYRSPVGLGESADGPDAVAEVQLTPGETRLLAGYIALFGEAPLVREQNAYRFFLAPSRSYPSLIRIEPRRVTVMVADEREFCGGFVGWTCTAELQDGQWERVQEGLQAAGFWRAEASTEDDVDVLDRLARTHEDFLLIEGVSDGEYRAAGANPREETFGLVAEVLDTFKSNSCIRSGLLHESARNFF